MIAAFGLVTAGVLALAAAALQLAAVDLAEEYVASSGAHQEQVLVTARGVLLVTRGTVGGALLALLLTAYSLAVLTARERLVPRWLTAIPALSLMVLIVGSTAVLAGASDSWTVMMSVGGLVLLWLIIAGTWLLFAPGEDRASVPRVSPASSG